MKNIKHAKSPTKLATPTDLEENACISIAEKINPLIADAFALYVKTKNYHWHMSGSHFRDYHLLFDEQASQIFEMIDTLAERVRKLGQTTIRSIDHIHRLQTSNDDNDEFLTANEMLKRLMHDNINYTKNLRAAHQVCGNFNDVATTSILEIFIDETERRTWFLYEAQVN